MMIQLLKLSRFFCTKIKSNRQLITPETFTAEPMQQFYRVTSKNYDFLLKDNPQANCKQIYVHNSDTPSNLLKKNAIHIYPEAIPQHSIQQKYTAYMKTLQQQYKKSYQKCKNPAQVFHLQRRIKSDIRNRCKYIGKVMGKYKHYNLFKSINQINSQRTLQQYKKNGINIEILGKNKIYPQGPVWLPTSNAYLKLLQQYLNENQKLQVNNIMDLGCGSGILSFMLAKQFKKAKIFAIDSNKFAVQTCSVNAATFQMNNITSFCADITNQTDFVFKLKQNKTPENFDMIICNPPWLIGKKAEKQSQILEGVYDNKGKVLKSSLKIAGKHLKDQKSRFILIYSDLSQNLGIQPKSIQDLCGQNKLLIHNKIEIDYPKAINKESPLSTYKLKSKIQLYEIGKS